MTFFLVTCYVFVIVCFAACVRRDDWRNAIFWLVLMIVLAIAAGGSLETFHG